MMIHFILSYAYIYITIGEFIAFIVGWDLIMEYIIGTSSAASALSKYVDSLAGRKISTYLKIKFPMDSDLFASYPDFLAFAFCVLIIRMIFFL